MSSHTTYACDGCGRELLLETSGPLRAHAVKIQAGHGVWDGEHELLTDEWQGDLCEDCTGRMVRFVRYDLADPEESLVKASA